MLISSNDFIKYVLNFSKESMILGVADLARKLFNEYLEGKSSFHQDISYTIELNGKIVSSKVRIAQTWLIDLIYEIACLNDCGVKNINQYEVLHLINIFNGYQNAKDEKREEIKNDTLLNFYSFQGEQRKFQTMNRFFENFSREKYILDIISKKKHRSNHYNIDR